MERKAKDAKPSDVPWGATGSLRVSYVPREDATPEGELAALACVYRYLLFQCQEPKRAAEAGLGEKGGEHDLAGDLATPIEPERKEKHD